MNPHHLHRMFMCCRRCIYFVDFFFFFSSPVLVTGEMWTLVYSYTDIWILDSSLSLSFGGTIEVQIDACFPNHNNIRKPIQFFQCRNTTYTELEYSIHYVYVTYVWLDKRSFCNTALQTFPTDIYIYIRTTTNIYTKMWKKISFIFTIFFWVFFFCFCFCVWFRYFTAYQPLRLCSLEFIPIVVSFVCLCYVTLNDGEKHYNE